MLVKNQYLEDSVTALMDVGNNRFDSEPARTIVRVKRPVANALAEVEEIKAGHIKACGEGEDATRISDKDPGWEDFAELMNELMEMETEIDVKQLHFNLLKGHKVKPESLDVLEQAGLLDMGDNVPPTAAEVAATKAEESAEKAEAAADKAEAAAGKKNK